MNIDDPQDKKDQQKEFKVLNKIWEILFKKLEESLEANYIAMKEINNKDPSK